MSSSSAPLSFSEIFSCDFFQTYSFFFSLSFFLDFKRKLDTIEKKMKKGKVGSTL